jgi:precorrin-6B methylase 2
MTQPASAAEGPRFPNPGLLMQLALAYRSSAVLFAAAELDVFSVVARGNQTAADVAKACGAKEEPMRLLLDACTADGTLTRENDVYANTPAVDAYLVKGRPAYIANGLKFAEDLYPGWGKLADLVRTGEPTMEPESFLGEDKEKTRAFVYAMHERAKGMSAVLPHGADFTGRKKLIDVGGGPGTYAMALITAAPGLTVTILDRPGVLEVTREIVDSHGFGDRITLLPGDYITSSFGSGFDAALLSGMMHRETPEHCQLLLTKAFDAMVPGGLCVVSDVFFDDEARTSPRFSTFFAINMALMAKDGTTHASPAMARWMADAGFVRIDTRPLPPPNPHTLVVGFKP